MAELIDKARVRTEADRLFDIKAISANTMATIKSVLEYAPTTTEAEIRAKAVSDFLKALEELTKKNWIDHLEYGITWADLELVSEQLKEE